MLSRPLISPFSRLVSTALPVLLGVALAMAGCVGEGDAGVSISVLSSPHDRVSGGDVRLAVTIPEGMEPTRVEIVAGGREVTPAFSAEGPRRLEGVVRGLPEGRSSILVRAPSGTREVELVNHSRSGPMFSGPPQEPFVCSRPEDRRAARLGAPADEDCRMETRVDHLYRSTDTGTYEPLPPGPDRPADMARTVTSRGDTVDYIVRWERGTINRFIYSIAVLAPTPGRRGGPDLSAWNGRLLYHFQGGVGVGHYQGAPSRDHMLYEHGLSKGYAIAYSTGTKTGLHYDLEVGGETALMVKDRFVTAYDDPLYTVGLGGSGGAVQQYVYGQNHPSLLDAAIPQYSYPDMVTQTIHVGDCELLERYMDAQVRSDPESKWATWSNRTWLEGLNASDTLANPYRGGRPGLTECVNGWRGLSPLTLNPHYGDVPGMKRPVRDTVEWTHYADAVQVYGRAEDGYAARTWDNEGVQYGLQALRAGRISPTEFLNLNARVGSWKNEPQMVQEGRPFVEGAGEVDVHSARNMRLSREDAGRSPAPRAEADPGAIAAAYREGLVFRGDLEIPVIDWRPYLERALDMHNAHQSFAARRRMLDHDGDAGNQIIWFTDVRSGVPRHDQTPLALEVIDAWMANIRATPGRSVAENRPTRARDACFGASGELLYRGEDAWAGAVSHQNPSLSGSDGEAPTGTGPEGPCARRFPLYGTARTVAGGPITGDVFKCHRQPVSEAIEDGVYGSWAPTNEQVERLRSIFPEGVCDYERGDARRPEDLDGGPSG